MNTTLDDQLLTDALTRLPNRSSFEMQLAHQCRQVRETHSNACLLLLDVDDFRAVNLSLGYELSDRYLNAVAAAIVRQTRAEDFVARLGGDKFAAILPGMGLEEARAKAEAICDLINEYNDKGPPITASIAVTDLRPTDDYRSAFQRADATLYETKLRLRTQTQHSLGNQTETRNDAETTDPMLALFAEWDAEDATDDPKELARRQREGDELQADLRDSRFSLKGRTDFARLLDEGDEAAA